jgi:hypothetical protein
VLAIAGFAGVSVVGYAQLSTAIHKEKKIV